MKFLFNKKVWLALFVVSGSILCITKATYDVALQNKGQIDKMLNSSSSTGEVDEKYFQREFKDEAKLKEHLEEVGKEIEAEGLVLLKNENNALPLAQNDKVSCMFNGSINFNYATSGSSAANTKGYKNLKDALKDSGLDVNEDLWNYSSNELKSYKRGMIGNYYQVKEAPWNKYTDEIKSTLSEYNNIIVTIARDSGEGKDVNTKNAKTRDGSYLDLSEDEIDVLKGLTSLKKEGKVKKIIVLLNSSQMIQSNFLDDENIDVDALLWVGNVGSYGIDAVSDALVGKINPSGKMSDTLLKDNFSSPAMMNQMLTKGGTYSQKYGNSDSLNSTQSYYGINVEGIYVGYRYYETRYYDVLNAKANVGEFNYDDEVAYPFGHGLSYTKFAYSNYEVKEDSNGDFDVSIEVKNVGDKAGKDVVEIYLNKPYTSYDEENSVEKAAVELVGFEKTKELAPNESEKVELKVKKESFKSYDSNNAKTYIVDEGKYHLIFAKDAHEATSSLLAYENLVDTSKLNYSFNKDYVYETEVDAFDKVTYSKSNYTDKAITNLFDASDINKNEHRGDNEVTYVSRKNWENTLPKENATITLNDEMIKDLASNWAYEETEKELPLYNQNNGLSPADLRSTEEENIPYDDPRWEKLLDQMSYEEQSNLVTSGQFATIALSSVNKPKTSENDGPTGVASTKTGTSFASEGIWASTFNKELIEKLGKAFGEDILNSGETGIYAGGVNIHRTPFGGRNHEYFSEDPYLSGIASMQEIKGIESKGVIVHVKHLAFNEQEDNRSGLNVWLNEQSARELYLLPFEYSLAKDKGNGHAVMSAFNRIGMIWAGAHKNIQENYLRDELGFEGYVITDMASSNGALFMTYKDGFMNGTDLFLGSGSEDALAEFKNSPTFAHKVREAAHHILYVVCNYSYAMNLSVDTSMSWWQATLLSLNIVFLVIAIGALALYIVSLVKGRKKAIE